MHNGTYDRLYNHHKHDHDASFNNSNTQFLGHVQYIPLEDYTFCIHLRLMVLIDVEIYVNGRKIGYGQIVVIDQNFGVRITNILGEDELVKTLS